MALAFFDLDGTILNGDSNELFFSYLLEQGVIDNDFLKPLATFQKLYYEGVLKIDDFVLYATKPLLKMSKAERDALIDGALKEKLAPHIKAKAKEAVQYHKEKGDRVLVVSATVDYLVRPVANAIGVTDVIAAPVALDAEGRLTQALTDVTPYQENKVVRINKFLANEHLSLEGSCAYGDSINDVQMLLMCQNRFAVDATSELLKAGVPDLKILSWKE